MKKIILLSLALILMASSSIAVDWVWREVKNGTTANLSQTRDYIGLVRLTNPTTDYVAYDLWESTGRGGSRKLYLVTVILPTKSSMEVELLEHIRYDFNISLSTLTGAGTFDGGLAHPVSAEVR